MLHVLCYVCMCVQISAVLYDSVPANGADHLQTVKESVRKFFEKSDPDDKGYVSEERFRAFCRYLDMMTMLMVLLYNGYFVHRSPEGAAACTTR